MTNAEVALQYVRNAKAYCERGDMATVMHNLAAIEDLLENPNVENKDYDWEDFK